MRALVVSHLRQVTVRQLTSSWITLEQNSLLLLWMSIFLTNIALKHFIMLVPVHLIFKLRTLLGTLNRLLYFWAVNKLINNFV